MFIVGTRGLSNEVIHDPSLVSTRESIASKMIALMILFSLCTTLVQSTKEGDPCPIPWNDGSPGICTSINNCPSEYQEQVSRNAQYNLCKNSEARPLVCCPKGTPPTRVNVKRGEIARKKCAEYSKFADKKLSFTLDRNQKEVYSSQCDVKYVKLIGGRKESQSREFPHMAAVGYDLKGGDIGWKCGGTLISEDFVLTAAHCTFSIEWGDATWVRLGVSNLIRSTNGVRPEDRRIIERIRHPDYERPSFYHDVALFRLESPVSFNARIRPGCLHTKPFIPTKTAIATGWGVTDWRTGRGSDDLRKVTVPVVNQSNCNASYFSGLSKNLLLPNGIVDAFMICAGSTGKGTCGGDSGGPLMISSKNKYYCMYYVVGVTNGGQICGDIRPGLFARVYNYLSWIEETVWPRG